MSSPSPYLFTEKTINSTDTGRKLIELMSDYATERGYAPPAVPENASQKVKNSAFKKIPVEGFRYYITDLESLRSMLHKIKTHMKSTNSPISVEKDGKKQVFEPQHLTHLKSELNRGFHKISKFFQAALSFKIKHNGNKSAGRTFKYVTRMSPEFVKFFSKADLGNVVPYSTKNGKEQLLRDNLTLTKPKIADTDRLTTPAALSALFSIYFRMSGIKKEEEVEIEKETFRYLPNTNEVETKVRNEKRKQVRYDFSSKEGKRFAKAFSTKEMNLADPNFKFNFSDVQKIVKNHRLPDATIEVTSDQGEKEEVTVPAGWENRYDQLEKYTQKINTESRLLSANSKFYSEASNLSRKLNKGSITKEDYQDAYRKLAVEYTKNMNK